MNDTNKSMLENACDWWNGLSEDEVEQLVFQAYADKYNIKIE